MHKEQLLIHSIGLLLDISNYFQVEYGEVTLANAESEIYYPSAFTGHYGLKCGIHANSSGSANYNFGYTLTLTSFKAKANGSFSGTWIAVGY